MVKTALSNSYYEKFADGKVVCIDDEIPFEIPNGWEWCRVREISQSYIGLTYSPSEVSSDGVIVLRSSNIQNGKISLNDIVRVKSSISEKLWVEENDIIICARNGSKKLVGKSAIVEEISEPMTFGAFMTICKTVLYRYVHIFLQSDLFFSQLRNVSGTTTINQLTQNNFNGFLIPIPPKREQERISNKLSDISPLVDKYGDLQCKLDSLNTRINELLKKSILQEAIQGKLVPQAPNDEPASVLLQHIKEEKQRLVKEGRLKKKDIVDSIIYKGDDNKYYEQIGNKITCIEEEIPFKIPKEWCWVRLSDIVLINPRNHIPDNTMAAFIPMERIDATFLSSYSYVERKWGEIKQGFTHFSDGDVAFAKITPCFQNRKSMILNNLPNGIGAGTTELKVLRPYRNTLSVEYLLFFLESPYFVEEAIFKGTANQQRIMSGYMESKLFPLPPLEEQKRISKKIKEVYKQMIFVIF